MTSIFADIIKGSLSSLLNAHKTVLLKIVMRFRIETNNSRRSFHPWKKESIDDVVIPIESYHMHDPFGTQIKHETELQQM
uniref:APO domain-containing protein n=1 Tax=Solanum lycopersicum TaxID=4081 RepID=A0A3Q7GI26_SOLLC